MSKNALQVSQQTTQKKIKFKGSQSFINASTGELIEMQVTDIEERDFNFSKVWMKNFLATIDLVGNQKTRFCFWLIDNLNRDNAIALSYRQMAEKADMSLCTVRDTMKILLDADFLRRVGTAYMVNPDVIHRGTRQARLNLLQMYHSAPVTKMTKEDKISCIENSIRHLQGELKKLQGDDVVDVEIDPQLAMSFDSGTAAVVEEAKPIKKGG